MSRTRVLAMGSGNLPAIQVWSRKTVRFGSRTFQKPDWLLHGGPNHASYPSTRGFRRDWLDPSGPISGSAFRVFLFMVAFRYPTVICKILTMVMHCHFLMNWQPSYSKQVEWRSLPHPENECHWSVNDWWSCILGNLSGAWSHVSINKCLAAFMNNWANDIPTIASSTVTSNLIDKGATTCSRAF